MRARRLIAVAGLSGALALAGCQSMQCLSRQATVTRAQAEQTALAKVAGGTVKEAELEKEDGVLVWSFDIAKPGTKDLTEILVDAKTGQIVSEKKETPEEEKNEK
jgi:uncharacterized membrane protein YkoI